MTTEQANQLKYIYDNINLLSDQLDIFFPLATMNTMNGDNKTSTYTYTAEENEIINFKFFGVRSGQSGTACYLTLQTPDTPIVAQKIYTQTIQMSNQNYYMTLHDLYIKVPKGVQMSIYLHNGTYWAGSVWYHTKICNF